MSLNFLKCIHQYNYIPLQALFYYPIKMRVVFPQLSHEKMESYQCIRLFHDLKPVKTGIK